MACFSLRTFGFGSRPVQTSPESSESSSYRVRLEANVGTPVGMTLAGYTGLGGLLVIDLGVSEVIRKWNCQNPNDQLEVGYCILEVNGITDHKSMMEAFGKSQSLDMLISTELTSEQRIVFKRSIVLHHKGQAVDSILRPGCPDRVEPGDCCSICHDDMKSDIVQLPCGHHFHQKCVKKWMVHSKAQCPLCNRNYAEDISCTGKCKEAQA